MGPARYMSSEWQCLNQYLTAYRVNLDSSGNRLEFTVAREDPAVDSVYGSRVGPPDQAKCIAAAKE